MAVKNKKQTNKKADTAEKHCAICIKKEKFYCKIVLIDKKGQ